MKSFERGNFLQKVDEEDHFEGTMSVTNTGLQPYDGAVLKSEMIDNKTGEVINKYNLASANLVRKNHLIENEIQTD